MENKRLELVIFSLIFTLLSVLTFFVFRPFLYIIVLGAVLSVLFHPLYKKLKEYLNKPPKKENGDLSSKDLAELGAVMRKISE